MVAVVADVEILLPYSKSLKDKRMIIKSLIDRIGNKGYASISEVDFKDLWQRSRLGIACVSPDSSSANQSIQRIKNKILSKDDVVLLKFEVNFFSL